MPLGVYSSGIPLSQGGQKDRFESRMVDGGIRNLPHLRAAAARSD
jgi:hypothetical protein